MNFPNASKEEINPFLQLLLLIAYAILGTLVFTTLAGGIVFIFYGKDVVLQILSSQITDSSIDGFKILQAFSSSVGMMAAPAILLALTEKIKLTSFYRFKKVTVLPLLLVFLILFASLPFMEWVTLLNQKMSLPSALSGIEAWMKQLEESAAQATIKLITVRNNFDFVVNLVVIALLPAIGEELLFRGGVQRTLHRMYGNPHASIWLSAIIFSAIHMQFYGFIPRMLLGAGFGYLYYYSGSLWYAMFGHFLNNGYAVCVAFYMQKNNLPLDKVDEPVGFPWYGYLISAIITLALFGFFKQTIQRERKLD
ncbi:lysostaphin resistance A-like protein [Pedobacter sp. AW1-32]|uniref:lysostaphin resistance A-like protein n=1 Tax=Pedobacter sp. AW1-32 TaxID=3383026 RepID=UPI003FF021F6